jgi:stearoyl-CoA desaturase (delta-9 desaturase)
VVSKRYDEKLLGHVADLQRYPELVWLNRLYFVPNIALLGALYAVGGLPALTYGGLVSIVITWHLAFSATVLFHILGKPAYETGDESKNSFLLGVLLCGEGWHNNHHANARSCNLGHEWWQLDIGYMVFVAFEKCGLVWSLNKAARPAHPGIRRIGKSSVQSSSSGGRRFGTVPLDSQSS